MHRSTIRYLVSLSALALAITVLPAHAKTAMERYLDAGKTFDALKAEANAKGEMPRVSDARTAEVLAVLSDRADIYGTPAFPVGPKILDEDLCGISNTVSMSYNLFGLDAILKDKTINPNGDPTIAAKQTFELMAKNYVTYQDEVVPLINFSRHCMAGVLPILTTFFAGLPVEQMTEIRRDGVRKMRSGIKGMVVGSVSQLGDAGIRDALRAAAFDGLKRDLPQLVPALSIQDREEVRKTVAALAAQVPAKHQDDIAAVLKALNTKTCVGLCAY